MESERSEALRRPRPSPFVVFLVAASAALAALDVLLVRRNRELVRRLDALTLEAHGGTHAALDAGDRFPALPLLDAHGRAVPLAGEGPPRPVLLFVSSPGCDLCTDVRPLWDLVARACRGSELRVLELVLEAGPGDLAAEDAPEGANALYPRVVAGEPRRLFDHIPGVPAALLLDASGTVRRAFYGTEQEGLSGAVEELLRGE